MIDIHQVLTFAVAAFLIVIVPGPNMAYLLSTATIHGRRAAVIALLGSNLALLTMGVIVGLGLNTLLGAVPFIFNTLKVAGALYLFWLAWKNIRQTPVVTRHPSRDNDYSDKKIFRTGYLTNLLNPKTAAFYLAIFPGFLNLHEGYLVAQGASLGLVHAIVSFCVNSTIIFFVRVVAQRFGDAGRFRSLKKWLSASIFTAFGIRMLLQKAT